MQWPTMFKVLETEMVATIVFVIFITKFLSCEINIIIKFQLILNCNAINKREGMSVATI